MKGTPRLLAFYSNNSILNVFIKKVNSVKYEYLLPPHQIPHPPPQPQGPQALPPHLQSK